jgi:hypothetical protein
MDVLDFLRESNAYVSNMQDNETHKPNNSEYLRTDD